MEEIRFYEIERLKGKVSGEFSGWSKSRTVTQEMINQFADLTGDHQWIHMDVERAKRESPFGAPVAHGFLILSLLPDLQPPADWVITGYGNVVNYGANKLRFAAPIPSGASIEARSRLTNVEQKGFGTLITQEVHIHVVGQLRPAVIYEMLVLYTPPAPPQVA